MVMLLSICLSIHNDQSLYVKALHNMHLKNLSHEIEVIVYDNASTDDTDLALRPFLWEGAHLLYYKSPGPQPPLVALQEMLSFTQGKYIWYVEVDTELHPNHIHFIQQQLHKQPEIQGLSIKNPLIPSGEEDEEDVFDEIKSLLVQRGVDFFFTTPHIIQKSIWSAGLAHPKASVTPLHMVPFLGLPDDILWKFLPAPSFFSALRKKTSITLLRLVQLLQFFKEYLQNRQDYQMVVGLLCTNTIPQLLDNVESSEDLSIYKFFWQMFLLCGLQPSFWSSVIPQLSKHIALNIFHPKNKKKRFFTNDK